jgi:hypothetical protein
LYREVLLQAFFVQNHGEAAEKGRMASIVSNVPPPPAHGLRIDSVVEAALFVME